MRDAVKRSHVRVLLATLLVLFFAIPILSDERGIGAGAILVQLVLAFGLAGGVYAVGENKLLRRLISGTLVPAVTLGILVELDVLPPDPWGFFIWAGYTIGFSLVGFAMTVHLMRERRVTMDTIASALATYLLFGLVWALFYVFFEHFDPDAFSGLSREIETGLGNPGEKSQLKAMLYYSFTTLTTLGYGDIIPVNPLVRSLAVLEAAFGQIYMAILVARLVGIYTATQITDD
jgi:hypothetical protein